MAAFVCFTSMADFPLSARCGRLTFVPSLRPKRPLSTGFGSPDSGHPKKVSCAGSQPTQEFKNAAMIKSSAIFKVILLGCYCRRAGETTIRCIPGFPASTHAAERHDEGMRLGIPTARHIIQRRIIPVAPRQPHGGRGPTNPPVRRFRAGWQSAVRTAPQRAASG